jgi:CHAT domain-containing protein
VWALVLFLLIPLQDTRTGSAKAAYEHALRFFQHGKLEESQQEAEQAYRQFQVADPAWAAKFQLLEAQDMVWRGMNDDAMRLLAAFRPVSSNPEETVWKLELEGVVLTRQQQFSAADQRLAQAESLCKNADYSVCGDVLRAFGTLAVRQGQPDLARRYYLATLAFAQTHHDPLMEASASLNLGFAAEQIDHYDEAVDWGSSAYRTAKDLDAEDLAQAASGNLGSVYYHLGDDERALELFLDAETSATRLGDIRDELIWIHDAGYVYRDTGDLTHAIQSFRQALYLARQIDNKDSIVNALEDLGQVSVESGKLEEASAYIDQVTPDVRASGSRLDELYVMLTQGQLAAARHQDEQAESLFLTVQHDQASQTFMRLSAGLELALLYEREGRTEDAEKIYKATLATFESARAELKHEESRLPFAANAARIYDDYIHLLVRQGKTDEALAVADQSRARTLAQDLGVAKSKTAYSPAALRPRQIAQKENATLLFYWLGEKQSYLWAITPQKVALIPLPAQAEIAARVERYRKALLNIENPLEAGNEDGRALYQLLVAPAAGLIRPSAPVIILADGALNQLNFETLLAPGSGPNSSSTASAGSHYWIEDATLISAPSLNLLSAAKPSASATGKLLLMGDAVSPGADYPELPMAAMEMKLIQKHFAPRGETVLAREQANPTAYAASRPDQFSYIHFVTHGTASRVDPLDSAIILSRANNAEGAFKLYAREIVEHPIDARLVTISACYGSGTRAYAGEGLVGLSWAFLRAGAHNVIGALWEVSDESTPRLMDSLYQGLDEGQSPSNSLRKAKLALLRSPGRFRAPFYWAPFQIYSGL